MNYTSWSQEDGPSITNQEIINVVFFLALINVVFFLALTGLWYSHSKQLKEHSKQLKEHSERWAQVDQSFTLREAFSDLKVWLKRCYGVPMENQEAFVEKNRDTSFFPRAHQLESNRPRLSYGEALTFVKLIGEKENVGNWFAHRSRPQKIPKMAQLLEDISQKAGPAAKNVSEEAFGIFSVT